MKTFIPRAAYAALLATSMSVGLVALSTATATAQTSPGNPNYSNWTRGRANFTGNAAVPASHVRERSGLMAQASAFEDNRSSGGQDPDPNVRLQLLRSEGIFDR